MRKLISLFLVLVMLLLLAPVTLAANDIIVSGFKQHLGTGTSFTPHEFDIYNDSASPTNLNFLTSAGNIEVKIDGGSFGPHAFDKSIAWRGNMKVSVRPLKTSAGTYSDTLTIRSSEGITINGSPELVLTFTYVITPAPEIGLFDSEWWGSAIPADYSFGRQYVGYTSPSSLIFYIRNTGNSEVTFTSTSITLTNTGQFDMILPNLPATKARDHSIKVIISPKTALPVGNYSATFTVDVASATSKSFDMNFTVDSLSAPPSAPPATNNYSNRTLTDSATGVSVSGRSIHSSAALSVTRNSLHAAGTCSACDTIRNYMANGQVLSVHNISMTRGHTGTVNVSIPVSSGYNGNRLTMAHCNGGVFESQDVYASNGMVTGAFSSLSPFAVISGLSDNSTGNDVIWPPKTGDPTSYKELGVILILLSATAGFIIMRYKRKAKDN